MKQMELLYNVQEKLIKTQSKKIKRIMFIKNWRLIVDGKVQ